MNQYTILIITFSKAAFHTVLQLVQVLQMPLIISIPFWKWRMLDFTLLSTETFPSFPRIRLRGLFKIHLKRKEGRRWGLASP